MAPKSKKSDPKSPKQDPKSPQQVKKDPKGNNKRSKDPAPQENPKTKKAKKTKKPETTREPSNESDDDNMPLNARRKAHKDDESELESVGGSEEEEEEGGGTNQVTRVGNDGKPRKPARDHFAVPNPKGTPKPYSPPFAGKDHGLVAMIDRIKTAKHEALNGVKGRQDKGLVAARAVDPSRLPLARMFSCAPVLQVMEAIMEEELWCSVGNGYRKGSGKDKESDNDSVTSGHETSRRKKVQAPMRHTLSMQVFEMLSSKDLFQTLNLTSILQQCLAGFGDWHAYPEQKKWFTVVQRALMAQLHGLQAHLAQQVKDSGADGQDATKEYATMMESFFKQQLEGSSPDKFRELMGLLKGLRLDYVMQEIVSPTGVWHCLLKPQDETDTETGAWKDDSTFGNISGMLTCEYIKFLGEMVWDKFKTKWDEMFGSARAMTFNYIVHKNKMKRNGWKTLKQANDALERYTENVNAAKKDFKSFLMSMDDVKLSAHFHVSVSDITEVLLFPGKAKQTAPALGFLEAIPNGKFSMHDIPQYHDLNEAEKDNKIYTAYASTMTVRQVLTINVKVLEAIGDWGMLAMAPSCLKDLAADIKASYFASDEDAETWDSSAEKRAENVTIMTAMVAQPGEEPKNRLVKQALLNEAKYEEEHGKPMPDFQIQKPPTSTPVKPPAPSAPLINVDSDNEDEELVDTEFKDPFAA